MSYGSATIGFVGYEGRFDYTANGNVVNLAARLCSQAKEGQIVVSQQVADEVEAHAELTPLSGLELKGFRDPVDAFTVEALADIDGAPGLVAGREAARAEQRVRDANPVLSPSPTPTR